MEEFACCSKWTQPDGCATTGYCVQVDNEIVGVPTAREFYAACAVAKRLGYGPPQKSKGDKAVQLSLFSE